jgi:hypothetical protein
VNWQFFIDHQMKGVDVGWDLVVLRPEEVCESVDDIGDMDICVLGTQEEMRNKISEAFAQTDWEDLRWGTYDGPDGIIEFGMGDELPEPVYSFGMHIHGGSDELVERILALAGKHRWQVLDIGSSDFIDQSEEYAAQSLQAFNDYRDRVISKADTETLQ